MGLDAGADSDGGQGARAPLSDHTAIIKFSGPIFLYRVEITLLFLYLFVLFSTAASVFCNTTSCKKVNFLYNLSPEASRLIL